MFQGFRLLVGCLATLMVLSLPGCKTNRGIQIKGTLTENNVPLKPFANLPPGVKGLQLCFSALTPTNELGEPYYAVVEDNGAYHVPGPDGKGIPPGRYRISVEVMDKSASGAEKGFAPSIGGTMGFSDKFKGTFSRERSSLQVELTTSAEVLIDVSSKGKVTVNEAPAR